MLLDTVNERVWWMVYSKYGSAVGDRLEEGRMISAGSVKTCVPVGTAGAEETAGAPSACVGVVEPGKDCGDEDSGAIRGENTVAVALSCANASRESGSGDPEIFDRKREPAKGDEAGVDVRHASASSISAAAPTGVEGILECCSIVISLTGAVSGTCAPSSDIGKLG
jgi:hypothetical protein